MPSPTIFPLRLFAGAQRPRIFAPPEVPQDALQPAVLPPAVIFPLRLFTGLQLGRLFAPPQSPAIASPVPGVALQPIVFSLAEMRAIGGGARGTGPSWQGKIPLGLLLPMSLSGVTRDSNGNALAGCTVKLYRTKDDTLPETTTSDAGGNYTFTQVALGQTYYVAAYKSGSPDVAGTTVNTLTGV